MTLWHICLAIFLLLFGLLALVPTGLPAWPLAVVALIAGVLILVNK